MNYTAQKGNLVRDIELKYLPSGAAVADFSVAVNEVWKNEAGEKQERVHFFDCVSFGKTAENLAKYFTKGMPILVSGSLAQDTWDDKATGQKRSKVRIKVQEFDFCGDAKPRTESSERPAAQRKAADPDLDAKGEDDIPF